MRAHTCSLALGLVLASAGCVEPIGGFGGEPVAEAWLQDFALRELAILAGSVWGDADLLVEQVDGTQVAIPVRLSGGTVGLGLEVVPAAPAAFRTSLRLPDSPVYIDDLLGWYTGSNATLSVIAGVETRHLKNRQDVQLDATFIPFGVAVMAGYEWLKIDARNVVIPAGGAQ